MGDTEKSEMISELKKKIQLKKIHGSDDYCVLYADLLDLAHREGYNDKKFLGFQEPNFIKLDLERQECIITVYAVFENNFKTIGTGHTSKSNVGKEPYSFHYVAVAETRAKARALRDALNIPVVSAEELVGGNNDDTKISKISDKQKKYIEDLLKEMGKTINKSLQRMGAEKIEDLNSDQADLIIKQLKKVKEESSNKD